MLQPGNQPAVDPLTNKKLTKLGISKTAKNANIPNADLSKVTLMGFDFSGANLEGVDFTKATLFGCKFNNANIKHAKFDHCLVPDAEFKNVNGTGASFYYAGISRSDFSGSNLSSELKAVKSNGNIRVEATSLTNFEGAIGDGVNFNHCNLFGVNFDDAKLGGANFSDTKISNKEFYSAFYGSYPWRVGLSSIILSQATLQDISLENASFVFSRLEMADFSKSDLTGLSLKNVTLWRTNFSHCNLSKMRVREDVIFDEAIMHFCNLADADLSHAISLETAKLQGSTYNKSTLFPQNFDPSKHGMKLKETL